VEISRSALVDLARRTSAAPARGTLCSMSERAIEVAHKALSIVIALTVLGGIATIVPVWPLVLVEHFRVQLAIGGSLVAIAAILLRHRHTDAVAITTLVTLVAIVPDLSASRRELPAGTPVRLLSINVLTANSHYDKVARVIEAERPDVIALVEVSQEWLDALAPSVEGYARIVAPRDDNFGVALFARGSVNGEIRELANRTPNIFADVRVGDTAFRIVVVHPIPPMSAALHDVLMDYFAELGALVRGDPRMVVAGDFNATPWSRTYATMKNASGLCDSRAGFGLQATRPADGWLLRIPIDHVLTSCAIGVRDHRIGPDVGSDHLPVVVDLVIPR
jgi:endonuclease/exonuclease/phosphatase (EEP) superfamily protein YafD